MMHASVVSKPWMSTARYAATGVPSGCQKQILGISLVCIQTESIAVCVHAVNIAVAVRVTEEAL